MDRKASSRWAWLLLPALAFVLLTLHLLLLLAGSHLSVSALAGGVLLRVLPVLGAFVVLAAWQAAKRSEDFPRTFWHFQAAGFSLWVLAQTLATVYDSVLDKPVNQPWPSDLLFFLWATPLFLSIFLDAHPESQRIEWSQWLDFAQVGILVFSAYIFIFEVPSHWLGAESTLKLALWVSIARNVILVSCFAFRTFSSSDLQVRSLYGRMTVFLTLYRLAECPYLYLQVYERLRPGTLWDLPFSLAFVLATFLIAARDRLAMNMLGLAGLRNPPALLFEFCLSRTTCFSMAVLLMAAEIAEQQFAIAAFAVLAPFACSSARIILSERQQTSSERA